MSTVKRYTTRKGMSDIIESEFGPFVNVQDYKKLEAENKELKERSKTMKAESKELLLELIANFYERNLGGGALHIVLDDHNVSNSDIEFCIRHMEDLYDLNDDFAVDDFDYAQGMTIAALLLLAPESEREDLIMEAE